MLARSDGYVTNAMGTSTIDIICGIAAKRKKGGRCSWSGRTEGWNGGLKSLGWEAEERGVDFSPRNIHVRLVGRNAGG